MENQNMLPHIGRSAELKIIKQKQMKGCTQPSICLNADRVRLITEEALR
jgi:hypothetical protein